MKVAPFDSCLACYRGDTATCVVFHGEAEFIIAAMSKVAGIPEEQAQATFLGFAQEDMGCEPGMVPVGDVTVPIRICRECVARNGMPPDVVFEEQDLRAGKARAIVPPKGG